MSMETIEKTILVIDDDREIATMLNEVLQSNGYRVLLAQNGAEGQRQIEAQRPDLVITDMMMPRMGGFPVLEFLKTLEHPPAVIMITANEGGRHKAYAEMLGVADYLRKPFTIDALLESVERIFSAQDRPSDQDVIPKKTSGKRPPKENDAEPV
jgi:DNA-binding response OmpR family regulator